MSHELRTPLTTVQMAADVLHEAREDFPPHVARSAELLRAELDRFEALLTDLLEISRYDAGAAVLDAEPVDLGALVARVVAGMCGPGGAARVGAGGRPARRADVLAEVDARRVERILRNLVGNAIEHGAGHPIEITLAANRTAAAMTVRDLGVGLTSAEAQHVFDRFWRADPSRVRTVGGSGLGAVDQPRGRPAARRVAPGLGQARRGRAVPAHAAAHRRRRADQLAAPAATRRDPASGGDVVSRRLLVRLVALAGVLLPLAACSTVPTSSATVQITQAESRPVPDVGIEPLPPEPGATPEEIVRGFIDAAASVRPGHPVAREHLTPAASKKWTDEGDITVLSPDYATVTTVSGTVAVTANLVGTVDKRGVFTVDDSGGSPASTP